ncbi:MAG: SDR family NAD(P)-dependent oxidoreductase [Candidatus Thermoplasmatota archaeon]|nr:SDR family NAD(P)-dependent oxidoreductase [Candidatus Thermoplasmatota archaeon]MEC7279758.1 SDR family NAD(P)-dependent oxidoreductase [Candidatus Thermoplasmatota archaeon]MEC9205134.1 SDR family NAD(P)-dependent oxidoreductase [Candidatus Thermoplasmatota archaeon]
MDLLGADFPFHSEALAGKRALICGASGGIGASTARMMAKAGASVVVAARSVDKLDALVQELASLGPGPHVAMALDLEDLAAVDAAVEELLSDGPVHVLVNNAGGPPGGALIDAEVDEFIAPFQRHLHASHTLVRGLLPGMETAGYGRILQIISTSVKEPIPNIGVSNTLRGAMASWAKTLSRELPPCVTINNVLPGFTATDRLSSLANSIQTRTGKSAEDVHRGWMDQVPIDRLIDPLETAASLTYLALPAAGAIRGVSLAVDGGRLRSI